MKQIYNSIKISLLAIISFIIALPAVAQQKSTTIQQATIAEQQTEITKANYDLAERFSPKKINKLVFSTEVYPNWFKNSNKFWYMYKTTNGEKYYIVDPANGSKKEIWDMGKLAAQISEITKDPFDSTHLPIENLKLNDDKTFTFEIRSSLPEDKKDKDKDKNKDKNKTSKEKPGKSLVKKYSDLNMILLQVHLLILPRKRKKKSIQDGQEYRQMENMLFILKTIIYFTWILRI
jgi:hypothetical protein